MELSSTFHSVYISTEIENSISAEEYDLHSTLFILVLVSFKKPLKIFMNLHSTLFILVPMTALENYNPTWIYIPLCLY